MKEFSAESDEKPKFNISFDKSQIIYSDLLKSIDQAEKQLMVQEGDPRFFYDVNSSQANGRTSIVPGNSLATNVMSEPLVTDKKKKQSLT